MQEQHEQQRERKLPEIVAIGTLVLSLACLGITAKLSKMDFFKEPTPSVEPTPSLTPFQPLPPSPTFEPTATPKTGTLPGGGFGPIQ